MSQTLMGWGLLLLVLLVIGLIVRRAGVPEESRPSSCVGDRNTGSGGCH